jgi:HlyD family secretion protein
MTANVTFVSAERDNVLRVPNAALRFRPPPELLAAGAAGAHRDGGWSGKGRGQADGENAHVPDPTTKMLWTLEGANQLKPRKVKVGVTDGSMTELTDASDLAEGAEVVTEVTGLKTTSTQPQGGPPGMRRMF